MVALFGAVPVNVRHSPVRLEPFHLDLRAAQPSKSNSIFYYSVLQEIENNL